MSTEDVNFAADETVEIKFTWYPSNRSVILFVVLVNVIPSTFNEASVPAIFCFAPFVEELSIEDNPDPEGLSVAVILNAFYAPVGDFITKLNVPSPEPTILAVMS